MAQAQRTPAAKRRAFNLTAISLYVGWNAGTLVGAVVGKGIGNPRDFGIEAIFPAVFLALLAPQLQRPRAPQAALAGAVDRRMPDSDHAGRRAGDGLGACRCATAARLLAGDRGPTDELVVGRRSVRRDLRAEGTRADPSGSASVARPPRAGRSI